MGQTIQSGAVTAQILGGVTTALVYPSNAQTLKSAQVATINGTNNLLTATAGKTAYVYALFYSNSSAGYIIVKNNANVELCTLQVAANTGYVLQAGGAPLFVVAASEVLKQTATATTGITTVWYYEV